MKMTPGRGDGDTGTGRLSASPRLPVPASFHPSSFIPKKIGRRSTLGTESKLILRLAQLAYDQF